MPLFPILCVQAEAEEGRRRKDIFTLFVLFGATVEKELALKTFRWRGGGHRLLPYAAFLLFSNAGHKTALVVLKLFALHRQATRRTGGAWRAAGKTIAISCLCIKNGKLASVACAWPRPTVTFLCILLINNAVRGGRAACPYRRQKAGSFLYFAAIMKWCMGMYLVASARFCGGASARYAAGDQRSATVRPLLSTTGAGGPDVL